MASTDRLPAPEFGIEPPKADIRHLIAAGAEQLAKGAMVCLHVALISQEHVAHGNPTLLIGYHILANKFIYRFSTPEPVDMIIFEYPKDPSRNNLGPITVPKDSYFVMGDNRDNSHNSRFRGFVEKSAVKGKAFLIS